MTVKLVPATDAHMCRERLSVDRGGHFYPSEASAVWVDKAGIRRVEGTCIRRSYFRIAGDFQALPNSAYSEWIFALGKSVENILVEQWKQMGVWVDNNVRFLNRARNISGEIDVILREPDGTLYGVEVKSIYGYKARTTVCGNRRHKARPKTPQLMQTLIYVDHFKDNLPYFKMVYYARDDAARNEFDITLTAQDGVHYPTIDGELMTNFTMEDIYARYDELQHYIEEGVIPDPDFELVWSPEKIEQRKALGEVSKTAYEKWEKNPGKNPIGDWQCRYCPYKAICWEG